MTKVRMVCRTCGSENVLRDAFAEWDVENQSWVLQNVFDDATCDDCGKETRIDEVPIDEESEDE